MREDRGCPALPRLAVTYLVRRAVRDRDAALRAPVVREAVLRDVPRAVVPLAVVVRAAGFFAAGFAALRTAGFAAVFAAGFATVRLAAGLAATVGRSAGVPPAAQTRARSAQASSWSPG